MLILKSLAEVQVLKCLVEILHILTRRIRLTSWKSKNSGQRFSPESYTCKQFLMDSSISMQCIFFEDPLPTDFLSQFEFSGSDSNMMENK